MTDEKFWVGLLLRKEQSYENGLYKKFTFIGIQIQSCHDHIDCIGIVYSKSYYSQLYEGIVRLFFLF